MKEAEFKRWAATLGVDQESLDILSSIAPPNHESSKIIYSYDGIKQINEDEDYPVEAAAVRSGFFVIGSCQGGDPIVLDLQHEPGSVHFVCHEDLEGQSIIKVKVADRLNEFAKRMERDELPIDYFEALDRR